MVTIEGGRVWSVGSPIPHNYFMDYNKYVSPYWKIKKCKIEEINWAKELEVKNDKM